MSCLGWILDFYFESVIHISIIKLEAILLPCYFHFTYPNFLIRITVKIALCTCFQIYGTVTVFKDSKCVICVISDYFLLYMPERKTKLTFWKSLYIYLKKILVWSFSLILWKVFVGLLILALFHLNISGKRRLQRKEKSGMRVSIYQSRSLASLLLQSFIINSARNGIIQRSFIVSRMHAPEADSRKSSTPPFPLSCTVLFHRTLKTVFKTENLQAQWSPTWVFVCLFRSWLWWWWFFFEDLAILDKNRCAYK